MILDLSRFRRQRPEPRRRRQDGDDPPPQRKDDSPGWLDACCLASCLLDLFTLTAVVSVAVVAVHRVAIS